MTAGSRLFALCCTLIACSSPDLDSQRLRPGADLPASSDAPKRSTAPKPVELSEDRTSEDRAEIPANDPPEAEPEDEAPVTDPPPPTTEDCGPTDANPDHCGACGQACSGKGVRQRTCGGGVCTSRCQAGRADCNGDKLGDGCETNTDNDDKNCGRCGKKCGGRERCTRGKCQ